MRSSCLLFVKPRRAVRKAYVSSSQPLALNKLVWALTITLLPFCAVYHSCLSPPTGSTQSWLSVKYTTARALLIKRIKLLPVSKEVMKCTDISLNFLIPRSPCRSSFQFSNASFRIFSTLGFHNVMCNFLTRQCHSSSLDLNNSKDTCVYQFILYFYPKLLGS